MTNRTFVLACLTPLFIFSLAFLALPLVRLFLESGSGDAGWAIYLEILRKPRYINTLVLTVLVSLATTVAALIISTTAGMFLSRNRFRGRGHVDFDFDTTARISRRGDWFFNHFARRPSGSRQSAYTGPCSLRLFRGWTISRISVFFDPARFADSDGSSGKTQSGTRGSRPYIRRLSLQGCDRCHHVPGLMPSLIASGRNRFCHRYGSLRYGIHTGD